MQPCSDQNSSQFHALKGITINGAKKGILCDVCRGLQDGRSEDAVVLVMKKLETAKGKMLRSSEWINKDGLWCFHDRIYVPMIPELQCKIVEQHHNSWIAGHAGWWKTLELVSRSYWWPNMS
jgi:hypothetical protein